MSDLEKLARAFHDAYETLAPSFGYTTRPETREFDPNSANGRLMMAVCEVVLGEESRRIRAAGRIEGPKEAAKIALFTPPKLGCEAIYARIQELEGEK